jgi:periplasmic protein CpxP/Spy
MKSTRIRILTIGAAVLLAVSAVVAQGPHGFGGPGDFHHMLKQLDLTSDQKSQVKADLGKREALPAAVDAADAPKPKRHEALQASGPFDEAKTRALATQNSQTMIELQVEHERMKSEIMQILTPDQKTKLAQLEAAHEANMGKHSPPPEE